MADIARQIESHLTVACVLRSGGVYDEKWVAKLRTEIGQHLQIPYRFICMSDLEVPCSHIQLEHRWPGWWSKIELFKLPPPVLYFDLDTIVVGDLGDIVGSLGGFTMLRDFTAIDKYGSGVMGWTESVYAVYEKFKDKARNYMDEFRGGGDQKFIASVMKPNCWQDRVPGQIVSYKMHCKPTMPLDARVVCMHGTPKFNDLPTGNWARDYWDAA